MDMAHDAAEALSMLGFTHLEADVYTCLLANPPMTGYGVAKQIGRPVANTYKAIETLQAKGAIMVEDGDRQIVRAVPYRELLARLERGFRNQIASAEHALSKVTVEETDEGVYTLTTVDQVYARAAAMLDAADEVAFLDLFPLPFATLKPAIERAVKRGVRIGLLVYEDVECEGVELVRNVNSARILETWSLQFMTLTVDAREHMVGALSRDGEVVQQAVWSASRILTWENSLYVEADLVIHRMLAGIRDGLSFDEIIDRFDDWNDRFPIIQSPGYRALSQKFGWGEEYREYQFPSIRQLREEALAAKAKQGNGSGRSRGKR